RAEMENKHAQALAEREALLHAMFEHPTEPITVLEAVRDANRVIVNWKYRNANTLTLELLGVTRGELLGRYLSDMVPHDRAETLIPMCAQVLESRRAVRYEAHYRGTDLLITLFPVGNDCIVSAAADITDHKRTETALKHSEARHRVLLENAPVAVAHNSLDGRFEYVNRAFCRLVGYSPEELYTRRWQDITHPEDIESDQALASQVVAGARIGYSIEKRYIRKDGSTVWVHLFGNVVADDSGQPVQGVAVVIDITDRNQANKRKDEFLAMLGHELRNPAAAISNATQALARLLKGRDQEQALFGIIERQIRHMSRLLDDLLDVARITQGHIEIRRELVPLQACVDLALETAQPLIQEKRHRLTTMQWFEPLWVSCDTVRIAQCITNLLTNAAKYTDAGGEIRLEMSGDEDFISIQVQDSGQGISTELLPQVFELFVQDDRPLDRSQGGLGIGLPLCRKLIEMHGGTIAATSPGVGMGATFSFRLPRAAAPAPLPEPLAVAEGTTARVLIVDDNRDAAQSLELILSLDGHTTQVAYSGQEALEQAANFDPEFALLDIGLPEMDGYEVARRMKEIVPRARLIAVTGYGLTEDRVRSAACGFEAHLVKPASARSIEEIFRRPPVAE
ncbi:MAG: PAS domain S-box protein, partial [Steroidobacter sp.]